MLREVYATVKQMAREGKVMLFVGTKKQAQDVVKEEAERAGTFFVNQRWLGGTLTNFATIQKRIARLRELEGMRAQGDLRPASEERSREAHRRARASSSASSAGSRTCTGCRTRSSSSTRRRSASPSSRRASSRSRSSRSSTRTAIPTRSTTSIPGNDDAIRAVKLMVSKIADAIIEGRTEAESDYDESSYDAQYAQYDAGTQPPPDRAEAPRRGAGPRIARIIAPVALRTILQEKLPLSSVISYKPSADEVKRLREETGAGMIDCRNALVRANGDYEAAKTRAGRARSSARRQEERAHRQRGARRLLHPHGRQDRRAASRSTARPTSSRATRASATWSTTSRCTSRRCRRPT